MKKKIVALCLVVALAATAIIGGTLAYFTDTDEATNTFTTANVQIDLIEQQRGVKDGEKTLVPFENNKVLMPIVGSAQGGNETVGGVTGLPTAKNYVDKIMTIQNLAVDAYVRLYIAIPAALDNATDAGQNILHFNVNPDSSATGQWLTEALVAENVTIDNVSYNVYSRTYSSALSKDDVTSTPAYIGFYLDKDVDYDGTNYTITRNGVTSPINFNFSSGVTIPVYAVGVQAAGFTDADTAINTAFGAGFNPWASTT